MRNILPISFGQNAYSLDKCFVREVHTPKGVFTVHNEKLMSRIELVNPEVIYTDEFAGEVSNLLFNKGQYVEVKCGAESFKTNFIKDELTSPALLSHIQNADSERISDWENEPEKQRIKPEVEIRREEGAWLGLFGRKNIYVIFDEVELKNTNGDEPETSTRDRSDFKYQSFDYDGDSSDTSVLSRNEALSPELVDEFLDSGGSKYLSAHRIEVEDSILWNLFEIKRDTERLGIVEVRNKSDKSGFGLYVEKGKNPDEIVINLNGRDEEYFEGLFLPLVLYLLEEGKKVYIDYDLEDESTIESRIYLNDTYDSIIEKTGAQVNVERITAYNHPRETHTYVILEPAGL